MGATSNHRLIVAHMPLIMVCLEGVGKLAEKFPMLAKQVMHANRIVTSLMLELMMPDCMTMNTLREGEIKVCMWL